MITIPRPLRRSATVLLACALVASLAPAAIAAEPITLAPTTIAATRPAEAADEILVRYRRGTTGAERRSIANAHGLTRLAASPDGRTEVVIARGRSAAATRRHLADEPEIVAVAPNHHRELADEFTDEPYFPNEWALHNTGQTLGGNGATTGVANIDIDGLQALRFGIGDPAVVVAVVDDGIDFDHPDLADRAWTNPGESGGGRETNDIDDDGNGYVDDVHGWDFCNNDNTVHDPGEDWHGTHVSGTIAASLDGEGTLGVAPGIQLMALKFIDNGQECGTDGMAVDAIDYAASFGVGIINASWGGPEPSTVLDVAIAASGALLVAAAGNDQQNMDGKNSDGTPGIRFYPAASTVPNVVSVAAIDQQGRIASFSNYGKISVDLVAPGTNILSTYPAEPGCSPCYAWSAGTSMAAPHVTGVAALVGSRLPALLDQPVAMRSRLLATGRGLTAAVGKTATGRMVNALRAIDNVAPALAPPDRFSVSLGSVVSTTSFTGAVRWNAATDQMSGVGSYAVKRKSPSGWSTVDSSTTDLFVRSSLRFGSAYTFRVRATDRVGNVSGAADGPSIKASLYSDGTAAARYSGSWRTVSSSSALRSSVHTSSKAGAWATYRFTGRSIAIVAPKGPTRGKFRVYVDGTLVSTVDLQRSSTKARVAVFARAWTATGTHTVKLVIVGSKRVDIDGFVVVR